MKKETILQYQPYINKEDTKAISDYLMGGGFITEYKKTWEFESQLSKFCNSKEAILYPNGTLTLFAIMKCLGIGQRDEVIVPNYTMAATAFSVTETGANVVFCDIEKDTLCISLDEIKKICSKNKSRIKAIIFMSANGRYPSYPIEELKDYCCKKSILLIEDSAQALGSYYLTGEHIGTLGIAGSFSFSMPKIITTGQGGFIVSNDETISKKLRNYKDFGRSNGGGSDDHESIGLNLKFTDLQAVLGISQFKRIKEIMTIKKNNYLLIRNQVKNDFLSIIQNDTRYTTPWFYEVLCPFRDELINHLNTYQICSRKMYPELNKQKAYKSHPQNKTTFPNSQLTSQNGVWIPSHPLLTKENLNRIIEALNSFRPLKI